MKIIKMLENINFLQTRNIGKAKCEEEWDWSPPPLSDFDLWYALAGTGDMCLNGKHYPIQKGSCFIICPGDQPQATQNLDERLQVIFIHFQCESKNSYPPITENFPNRYTNVIETHHFELLLNRILEIEERNLAWKEAEFDWIMKQVFLLLFRQQIEKSEKNHSTLEKQSHLIRRVISYIKEAPGYRISHDELAEKVNLSPEYLSKIFKKNMGISMREYVTNARLERALYLLQETSMNVSQTSDALGYGNVHFFSKQFKNRYGHPPSDFKHKGITAKSHGKERSNRR
jgi:AraC-like DNA-binding protein